MIEANWGLMIGGLTVAVILVWIGWSVRGVWEVDKQSERARRKIKFEQEDWLRTSIYQLKDAVESNAVDIASLRKIVTPSTQPASPPSGCSSDRVPCRSCGH